MVITPARVARAILAGLLIGCTGQSLYTTPRTVGTSDLQVVLAPEVGVRTRAPIQPAGTGFVDQNGPTDLGFATAGLAFQFRRLPDYDRP